ncbi:flagellar basal-body MS-ring/collar protein FliF [Pseudolysinimonas sp.]|jgi:flagellar M-ring protein FliF|uniref:flagellar basal-body MS-ring/collar protein FliF n=1 Tax=Pseudolysinimonas sp. TaxID=2680009 RepID=UPI0037831E3E
MPTQVRGALERALHALREFTVAQRTLALIGLAVLVVGAIAVGAWITRPQYVPLYSGLPGADASAIVEQLEAADVAYELADGGTTIMVPQQDVAAQRIAAAAAGLPGSESGGYALLDSMGVTASEFQQSVTYKRALEGELARTLQGLSGVTAASVQLALPEESVFVAEQAPATAAVFLETASGRTLSVDQIMSVQHLVSSSVPGLAVEDVSVVDADGTLLSATTSGSADQAASDYETSVRERVQTMLDQIVGVGNATVAVSAQVDAASAQQTSETFSAPEEGDLVLQESTTAEIYGSGATADGEQTGVLGPDNIAVPNDAAATDGTTTDDGYSNTTADRVNAINKVTEVRTIPAGTLVKQSISIAIDEAAAEGISASKIEELVAAAAGIDTERGDAVAVEVVAFAAAANAETAGAALDAAKEAESQAQFQELLQTAIIAGSVVLVFVIGIVVLGRSRRRGRPASVDLGPVPATPVGPLLDDLADQPVVAGFAAPPQVTATDVAPTPEPDTELSRARAAVDSLARTDPQRTAEYLRRLMDEPAGAR